MNPFDGTPSKVIGTPVNLGRRFTQRRRSELLACAILALMGATLLSLASRDSLTNDEVIHIPAGYNQLVTGEFRLNPEHPPLVKILASFPLLLVDPDIGPEPDIDNQSFGQRTVVYSLDFWRANKPILSSTTFWARTPMVLITLSLGLLIFIFGRELFGARAATFSLALFSLEPTMLAHGWIVHTDIAASFGYLVFLITLWAWFRAPSFYRALLLGVVTGLALAIKFSLVILIPILLGGFIFLFINATGRKLSRSNIATQFISAAFMSLLAINAVYDFQHPALAQADVSWIIETTPLISQRVLSGINALSLFLPTYYLFGLYAVFVHNRLGHPASILGHFSAYGWWYYFPVAFALKTTLPFLILTVVALSWAVCRGFAQRECKLIALISAGALYLALSMTSNINIGIRHIAPVFPFLFLLGGAFLDRILRVNSWSKVKPFLILVLFGWMLGDAVRIYPDYLSFINPLRSGKAGWELMSDSNVEWGQDMAALAQYLHSHNESQLSGALAAGWATAHLYDIQLLEFAPSNLGASESRYVAIGASYLNGSTMPTDLKDNNGHQITDEDRRNYFAFYRTAIPEVVIGNSIFVYRRKN